VRDVSRGKFVDRNRKAKEGEESLTNPLTTWLGDPFLLLVQQADGLSNDVDGGKHFEESCMDVRDNNSRVGGIVY
jgi:hypothetical protein